MAQTETSAPNKNQWWGYIHANGSIHVKRYFDKRDIEEAEDSDFCYTVVGPFGADTREEALIYAQDNL